MYDVREALGRELAMEHPVEADMVVPVPDSSIPAALGYAQASGIPFGQAIIKNRYSDRSFIKPDQRLRTLEIDLKFNMVKPKIEGKEDLKRRVAEAKAKKDAIKRAKELGLPPPDTTSSTPPSASTPQSAQDVNMQNTPTPPAQIGYGAPPSHLPQPPVYNSSSPVPPMGAPTAAWPPPTLPNRFLARYSIVEDSRLDFSALETPSTGVISPTSDSAMSCISAILVQCGTLRREESVAGAIMVMIDMRYI